MGEILPLCYWSHSSLMLLIPFIPYVTDPINPLCYWSHSSLMLLIHFLSNVLMWCEFSWNCSVQHHQHTLVILLSLTLGQKPTDRCCSQGYPAQRRWWYYTVAMVTDSLISCNYKYSWFPFKHLITRVSKSGKR